ncbi:MAG: prolyl-tRNA synthetase associated domain-containing protein [Kiloniellaceae bacterium]
MSETSPKEAPGDEAPGSEAGAAGLPTSPAALHARLDALGIAYNAVSHPAVFTVEEAKALRGELPGSHIKNLFLRNKKGRMWLVTCLEDRQVDLKALGDKLDAGRLSFGSAERLMTYLGVRPGAVTPFAVINDKGGEVTMVLDSGVLKQAPVNCHPLVNTMTTALAPGDLVRFLEAEGHTPQMLDMG